MFRDDYDEDYGDGLRLTCIENRPPEYLEKCDDIDTTDAELEIDNYSLSEL